MDLAKLHYVVVEGPIGVGKTSLASRLADRLGAQRLLEAPEHNPFLPKFYRDSPRYALPTQLFFLFQRVEQLRSLAQADLFGKPVVGDFLLDKDPLFAQLTLSDDELALYRQIYESLRPQTPIPDLVIYLHASAPTLIDRVVKRGNPIEAGISQDYLARLAEAYGNFFHHFEDAPVLMINTDHLNPVDAEDDFALFVSRIEGMRGKREFFNRQD